LTADDSHTLSTEQLETFATAFHLGAARASEALAKWIDRPAHITLNAVEQLPLEDATGVLGAHDEPICFCVAEMGGRLTGQIILAFDDASGLMLADMLMNQPRGTAAEWNEMETSAALETTNILCCAFLNSLATALPDDPEATHELIPTPPRFARDFAESLVQFAVMPQIISSDQVLVAHTEFKIDGEPVDWTMLFVPDAQSMSTLHDTLR
jgi:chemotaxis protein CheC